MRVLYVEDEKFLAEAVKHNLEKEKIDCDLALDGEDGLNKAIDEIYDNLPDKEGLMQKLMEMYTDQVESLFDEPEKSEKNAVWGANF